MISFRILIFFHCLSGLIGQPVPLVLWGEDTPKMPVMHVMQPYELQEIIFSLMDKHTILIFVENDLTSKDLMCVNPETNKNCYRYMRSMDNLNYYAQVHNPIETLQALIKEPPIKWQTFDIIAQKLKPFICHVGEVYGFEFTDQYESRVEQLIAHDAMIAEFSWNMDCPLVQIYTTRSKPKLNRRPLSLYELYRTKTQAKTQMPELMIRKSKRGGKHRQAYQPDPRNAESFFSNEYFALRYQYVYLLRSEAPTITRAFYGHLHRKARNPTAKELLEMVTISGMKVEPKQGPKSGFTVNFDSTPIQIALDLLTIPNYAGVRYRTMTGDGVNYGMMPFNVPDNRSYCCSLLEAYGTDKSMLMFHNVQFQTMRFGSNGTEQFEFDEPIYCAGVLTPNIMGGLVIAFLMVFIGGVGLLWILDIGSNARMDDPLGPDLQLKAHE